MSVPKTHIQNAPAGSASAGDGKASGFLSRVAEEVRFFLKLGAVMLVLLTLVWGHYKIPSESMQPTLEVGDHIYVSKFAYGYSRHSLPFGLHNLPLPDGKILSRLPKRGDVVVFRNPNNGTVMIKRTVGLPGDEVQVSGGRLYLNGALIEREPQADILYRMSDSFRTIVGATMHQEFLPGDDAPHFIFEQSEVGPMDETDVFVVPQGHVFFMGDNRDRSTDSRVSTENRFGNAVPVSDYGPGFVPLDHLIGRADLIMFSFNRCDDTEGLRCPEAGRVPSRL